MQLRTALPTTIVIALLLAPLAPRDAAAQPVRDPVAAETLFEQARALVTAGKHAEACPKFAESHRLDPGVGVLFHLGDCYEHVGKLASAWASFREALHAARAEGQAPREQLAKDKIAALEPRLPKLTIVFEGSPPAGLEVKRDGVLLGAALLGTEVYVDPGSHLVEATAPGKQPFSRTIEIAEKGVERVAVPSLADAPGAAPSGTPTVPPPEEEGSGWSGQRTAGLVTAGVGVAALAVGSVFGAMTLSTWSDAEGRCEDGAEPLSCEPGTEEIASDASSQGTISTVFFIAGGALVAGGAVLFFTAPDADADAASTGKPPARRAAFAPWASPEGAGATVRGRF